MSINKTHNLIKKKLPSKINGYKVDKEICKMSEGTIYTGKNLLTYQNVLFKVYNKEIIQFQNQQLSLINNEIFIFKFLSHKNILQLYEIIESKYFIVLIFEYFQGEKLSDKLKKITRFSEDDSLYIYNQIIEILLYTHNLNICLLNIKPDIFLIDNKNNIKLCDLKYATLYKANEKLENTNKELENIFACPEIHIRKPFLPELADTWSSGVFLYYILTGEHPFNDINDLQLIKSILKSEYILREGINKDFLDLFDNLLDYREDKRYKLKNIYESNLFKSKNINMPIAPFGNNVPIIKDIMNLCKINYGLKPIAAEKNLKEYNLDKQTSLYKQVINNMRNNKKDFEITDCNDGDSLLKINLDSYITEQKENKTKNKEKENKFLENQKNILKSIENVKVKYLLYKKNKEVEEEKAKKAEQAQNAKRPNRFQKYFNSKSLMQNARKRNSVCFIQPKEFGKFQKRPSILKNADILNGRKKSIYVEEILEEDEFNMYKQQKSELEQQLYVRQIKDDLKKEKEIEIENERKKMRESMKLQHMNNKNKFLNVKVRNIDEEIKKAKMEQIKNLKKKNKDLINKKNTNSLGRRQSISDYSYVKSRLGSILNDTVSPNVNKGNNVNMNMNKNNYARKRKSVSLSENFFINKLSKKMMDDKEKKKDLNINMNNIQPLTNQNENKINENENNINNEPNNNDNDNNNKNIDNKENKSNQEDKENKEIKKDEENKTIKEEINESEKEEENKESKENKEKKEDNKNNDVKKIKKKKHKKLNSFDPTELNQIESIFDEINSCKNLVDEIFDEIDENSQNDNLDDNMDDDHNNNKNEDNINDKNNDNNNDNINEPSLNDKRDRKENSNIIPNNDDKNNINKDNNNDINKKEDVQDDNDNQNNLEEKESNTLEVIKENDDEQLTDEYIRSSLTFLKSNFNMNNLFLGDKPSIKRKQCNILKVNNSIDGINTLNIDDKSPKRKINLKALLNEDSSSIDKGQIVKKKTFIRFDTDTEDDVEEKIDCDGDFNSIFSRIDTKRLDESNIDIKSRKNEDSSDDDNNSRSTVKTNNKNKNKNKNKNDNSNKNSNNKDNSNSKDNSNDKNNSNSKSNSNSNSNSKGNSKSNSNSNSKSGSNSNSKRDSNSNSKSDSNSNSDESNSETNNNLDNTVFSFSSSNTNKIGIKNGNNNKKFDSKKSKKNKDENKVDNNIEIEPNKTKKNMEKDPNLQTDNNNNKNNDTKKVEFTIDHRNDINYNDNKENKGEINGKSNANNEENIKNVNSLNLNEMKIKIKKKNKGKDKDKDKNHLTERDNIEENLNINNEYKENENKNLMDNKNELKKEERNIVKEDNYGINNIYTFGSNFEISINDKAEPKIVQKNEISDSNNPDTNELSTNIKNKKRKNKKKSKEKNHNLIICRNIIDFIVFGKEGDNYNIRKSFEPTKSTDKISNKKKKLLLHRNTKSISNQTNKLLLELSEEKKNINKETLIKFKTSNNFYKREKDLLRKKKTHSEDKHKKNITYINNNIDMFNFNFSNNKNNRNYKYSSLNKEFPSYQNQNKINFKIDEENNIEEESYTNSDKMNNLFTSNNMIDLSTPTKYRINSKKRDEIKKYKYGSSTNEKGNYNNLNEYIKELQLRNQNKAKRKRYKANKNAKKDYYIEKRKAELQNKYYNTMENFYRDKKIESPESRYKINNLAKTNKKTLISLNKYNNYNNYLSPRQFDTYNIQIYYTPEKKGTVDDIKTENNKSIERNKNEDDNKNNIKIKTYQKKNNNYSFLPNLKYETKSRSKSKNKYPKSKENNKEEGSGKRYHMINKNKKYDKDDDNINYLFNSISNFKKYGKDVVEDYKNRLKLKLISLTDDLKDENEEEKLKYYIGPIDLSLISIKGNLKESIEDLKYKFNMNGYECLDNDNKNKIKSQVKYIKNGIIYIAEVVKIKNNLLYYLLTKQQIKFN